MTDRTQLNLGPRLRTYYLEADLRDYGRLNDETVDSVRYGAVARRVCVRPASIWEQVQRWRVLFRRKIILGARSLAANVYREATTWIRHGSEGSA